MAHSNAITEYKLAQNYFKRTSDMYKEKHHLCRWEKAKYNQFSSRRRVVDRKLAWFREAGNIYPQSLAYFPAFNGKFSHEYNEEEWNMKSEVLLTIQNYYPVPVYSKEME